jgi:NTP pyrophosphatase (non-canonical NTP hydrolase)
MGGSIGAALSGLLSMDFSEYQRLAKRTNLEVVIGKNFVYSVLGLTSEAGELAGKVKKLFRDSDGEMTHEIREKMIGELGDVLWYLAQISTDLTIPLDEVAKKNIEKLASRMERGTLQGSGDNR